MYVFTRFKQIRHFFAGLLFFSAYSVSFAQFNLIGTSSDLSQGSNATVIYEFSDSESSDYQQIYVGSGINTSIYQSYFTSSPQPTVVSISSYPTEGVGYFVRTSASYNYFSGGFTTPGLYSLTVRKVDRRDPIGAIYVSNDGSSSLPYDPSNPLTNLYAFSDDSGGGSANEPWTVRYNKTTSGCTFVQFLIYSFTGNNAPNVDYTISGPGEITSGCGPSAPSLNATYLSMLPNAAALRSTFNLESAKIAQGLSYDCLTFDKNNLCVSFAGTRSYGNDGIDYTTGALIIAHRPTANIRFGGYVDQNIGTADSMGLKVKRGSPGYGVFGVWSQRTDGLGTQVRVAANSGSVDIETTRQAILDAEAGVGQSNIKSNGVQLELSQGYAANTNVIVRPYIGYRQTTNKRAAYTEMTSASALFPLSYTALKQTTESVLVGVKLFAKLTPKTSLNSNFGFEHDVKSTVDNYQAVNADIGTISPINMNDSWLSRTRPVASVGLVHSLEKTQTVGLFVTHRKEALQSSSTTSGMLQYSVGF